MLLKNDETKFAVEFISYGRTEAAVHRSGLDRAVEELRGGFHGQSSSCYRPR